MGDPFVLAHRAPIILAAFRNNVPTISFNAVFPRDGGLLSYGPDLEDMFRRAANRIKSEDLLNELIADATPWANRNNGKPVPQRQIFA